MGLRASSREECSAPPEHRSSVLRSLSFLIAWGVCFCGYLLPPMPADAEETVAFFVGVQDYIEGKYDKLTSVSRDAEDIFDRLRLITPNFKLKRSRLLLGTRNRAKAAEADYLIMEEQLTANKITTEFRKFLDNIAKNDTVIIYFGGHGLNIGENNNESIFLPGDYTDENQLYISYDTLLHDLKTKVSGKENVKIVFFANMCGSGVEQGQLGGSNPQSPNSESLLKLVEKHNAGFDGSFALIPATADDAPSFEDAEDGRSRLAHLVLKGMSGPAAKNDNTSITTGSLYDYVDENIEGGLPGRNANFFNEDIQIGSLRREEALASLFFALSLVTIIDDLDYDNHQLPDLVRKTVYAQLDHVRELEILELQAISALRKLQFDLIELSAKHDSFDSEINRDGDRLDELFFELEKMAGHLRELRDTAQVPPWVQSESKWLLQNFEGITRSQIGSLSELAQHLGNNGHFSTIQFCVPDCSFVDMQAWWRAFKDFDGYQGGYRIALSERFGLTTLSTYGATSSHPDSEALASLLDEEEIQAYLDRQNAEDEAIDLCPSLESLRARLLALQDGSKLSPYSPLILSFTGLWPLYPNGFFANILDETCEEAVRFYADAGYRLVPRSGESTTIQELLQEIKNIVQGWPSDVFVIDLTSHSGLPSSVIDFFDDIEPGKITVVSVNQSENETNSTIIDFKNSPIDRKFRDQREEFIESGVYLNFKDFSYNLAFLNEILGKEIDESAFPDWNYERDLIGFVRSQGARALDIASRNASGLLGKESASQQVLDTDLELLSRPTDFSVRSSAEDIFGRIYDTILNDQLGALVTEPLFLAASGCLLTSSFGECLETSPITGDFAERQGLFAALLGAASMDLNRLEVEEAIGAYQKIMIFYDEIFNNADINPGAQVEEVIRNIARQNLKKIEPRVRQRIESLTNDRARMRFVEVPIDEYSSSLILDLEYADSDLREWWKEVEKIPGINYHTGVESISNPENKEILEQRLKEVFEGRGMQDDANEDVYIIVISGRGLEYQEARYLITSEYDPTQNIELEIFNGNVVRLEEIADLAEGRKAIFIYDVQFTRSELDPKRYDHHHDKHAHSLFVGRSESEGEPGIAAAQNSLPRATDTDTRLVGGGVPDGQVHVYWDGTLTQATEETGGPCITDRFTDKDEYSFSMHSPFLTGLLDMIDWGPYATVRTIGRNVDNVVAPRGDGCRWESGNLVIQGDLDAVVFDTSIQADLASELYNGRLFEELLLNTIKDISDVLVNRFKNNDLNVISDALLEIVSYELHKDSDQKLSISDRDGLLAAIERLKALVSRDTHDDTFNWHPSLVVELIARSHMALGNFRDARNAILDVKPETMKNDALIWILAQATDSAVQQDAGELVLETENYIATWSPAHIATSEHSNRKSYIQQVFSKFSSGREISAPQQPYQIGGGHLKAN